MARIRSAVAALLIIAACIFPKALADPYLMDAGSIWISESSKEYLDDSGHVLRYRIVSVDSDRLQASLVGLAEDAGTGDMPTLELQLFDDVSLIVGIRSWTGGTFKVVVRLAGATCGSDLDRDGSNGSLNFSKQGHVVGRFWVCDQIYTIGPTNDLVIPYHVISMLDPENLPSID